MFKLAEKVKLNLNLRNEMYLTLLWCQIPGVSSPRNERLGTPTLVFF